MTTVYLVTHTESTHHLDDLVGGWFDSELTERGQRQAQAVAAALAQRCPRALVYSSDLARATQTAAPIAAAYSVPVSMSADLRELSCGIAEGRPQSWLDARIQFPPGDASRIDHRIIEGAESRRDVAVRTARFVSGLLDPAPDTAVVVTHGFAASFVVAAWLGMPTEAAAYVEFEFSPGGITTLEMHKPWGNRTLSALNDTWHLREL